MNNNQEKHPTTFIIFGATGDLMQKKLAPALFKLFEKGLLPTVFQIVGFSRRPWSHEEFREYVKSLLPNNQEKIVSYFLNHVYFHGGNLDEAKSYEELAKCLHERDAERNVCSNKLFYLAVPPVHYRGIFERLSASGLTIPCVPGPTALETIWTRVLVEKPFGTDLHEARELETLLASLYKEEQIFRIDHYLGKSSLQNILTSRLENRDKEKFWNKDYISKIEARILEENQVGKRGAFYDPLGAIADVGQNHLLQMLALATMELPIEQSAEEVRKSRSRLLSSLFIPDNAELVRGQYYGYLFEEGVNKDSKTETYFKLKLGIDSERWKGVPVYIESGKAFAENAADVSITMRDGKVLKFIIEDKPGTMSAYEKVLSDCIDGDQTIFATTQEVEAEWKLIGQVREVWKNVPLVIYEAGKKI